MDAYISKIIEEKLEGFLKSAAKQLKTEEGNLMLVAKTHQSKLGLFLYQNGSFVRQIKTQELLEHGAQ